MELGDLLFSVVNVARHLSLDAETALRAAASKFRRRFERVETLAQERGLDMSTAGLETLDALWDEAKGSEQTIGELSGGNQQKIAIARVLHQQADILLLDEPTRGIDVGTKSEIYRLMGELAAEGKAIIFISSYLTELMAVCDRIGVMSRGQLREVRAAADWTEEAIMSVAVTT